MITKNKMYGIEIEFHEELQKYLKDYMNALDITSFSWENLGYEYTVSRKQVSQNV